MKRDIAILTMVYLFAGLSIVLALDYLVGATAMAWFYVPAVSVSAAVGGLGWWFTRRRVVAIATLAITAGLIALRFVAISPVKPFRDFHRQLEPEMSMEAVIEELDRAFPTDGRYLVPVVRQSPDRQWLAFTLDPSDGRYNSEIIMARFDQGGLGATEYLPD